MSGLPALFLKRIEEIIPREHVQTVLRSFATQDPLSVRINTLRSGRPIVQEILKREGVRFDHLPWNPDALIIKEMNPKDLGGLSLIAQGQLYRQGLSSMLPPLVLNPKAGECVLDLCAAPGSKTSQMAAMMNNEGCIWAVESVRGRFYQFKSVLSLLGVEIVQAKMLDGRRFRPTVFFDRILVDAPCSSEGRFKTFHRKTFQYWSLRKIKEMVRKQKGLLLSASRLLKPGGVLVYSTCTFAPEENEGVIDWFLRKTEDRFELTPIQLEKIKTYPALALWQGKEYDLRVQHCCRVLPSEQMSGFFMAKLKKVR